MHNVSANIFATAGRAFGFKGTKGWFGKMETEESHPVTNLESHVSSGLTVEQWFIAAVVAVGNAGWEEFAFFPVADITFPSNAWIMNMWGRRDAGSPEGGMILERGQNTGMERILSRWTGEDMTLMTNEAELSWVPLPYQLSERTAAANGVPVTELRASTIRVGIDPTIIGDQVRFTVRVRSAPPGVRVWGRW